MRNAAVGTGPFAFVGDVRQSGVVKGDGVAIVGAAAGTVDQAGVEVP